MMFDSNQLQLSILVIQDVIYNKNAYQKYIF